MLNPRGLQPVHIYSSPHKTSRSMKGKRLKLCFENEILFFVSDNINCNVSSHFDRIPSKDANYLPQIKLLSKLHAIINQRKCNPCNLYNKLSCKYVKKKMKNDDSIILY